MIKSISIQIDMEKYSALKMYAGQKNTTIESELEKFTEQLYQKYVPQNVRDFIDMKAKTAPPGRAKRGVSADNSDRNIPESPYTIGNEYTDETQ